MRIGLLAAALALSACTAAAASLPAGYHLVPGQVTPGKGPDGNSIFIDAPDGMILVDTGRHPEHRDRILAYARQRGRPIVAIVNTHWHFDHTTGNGEILAAFPGAEVIASPAIDGALFKQFMATSRKGAEEYLASGQASEAQTAEIRRGFAVMDNLAPLKAKAPVVATGPRAIAGRRFEVHLAPFAATEGDVWLYDPQGKVAIVGDLVVDLVPFMDTACVDGWSKALNEVAAKPFESLVPGHGPVMSRADFDSWKSAFDNFVDCGRSTTDKAACVAGWERDAARFIDEPRRAYVKQAADYYLSTRLRSSPDEQQKYCRAPASAKPD